MTASEAKIRANRENARRSTGPRSESGKRRASTNARRHGLAIPIDVLPELWPAVERLTGFFVGHHPSPERREAARRLALAQVDLGRIRHARHEATRTLVENPGLWVDQTVPEFHYGRPPDKSLHVVFMAARLGKAAATNARLPALAAWCRTLDRLDRYERRALSRRKTAARNLADLE